MEMWVLLIASSAAPLWPLLNRRDEEKSEDEELQNMKENVLECNE